jgi:subtilisin family serine protease
VHVPDSRKSTSENDGKLHHAVHRTLTDQNGGDAIEDVLIDDHVVLTLEVDGTGQLEAIINEHHLNYDHEFGDGHLLQVTGATGCNPVKLATRLRRLPGVLACEPQILIPTQRQSEVPLLSRQWYFTTDLRNDPGIVRNADANVVEAWQETTGTPDIVVAVLDDGFDLDHPALKGLNTHSDGRDFVQGDSTPQAHDTVFRQVAGPFGIPITIKFPGDYHGTPVASIAVGADSDQSKMRGVASGCTLLPIKIALGQELPQPPHVTPAALVEVFKYVSSRADVANCSFGASPSTLPIEANLKREIAALTRTGGRRGKGLVIVFAAGNDNAPTYLPSANNNNGVTFRGPSGVNLQIPAGNNVFSQFPTIPGVITVAASSSKKRKSGYSNWGPHISVCAPSSNSQNLPGKGQVAASNRDGHGEPAGATSPIGGPNYTEEFGGTSGAAPIVSGTAALILSVNNELTAAQVKSIIESTASQDLIVSPNDITANHQGEFNGQFVNGKSSFFGAGKLDAAAAVRRAKALAGTVPSTPVLTSITEISAPAMPVSQTPGGVFDTIQIGGTPRSLRSIRVSVEIDHQNWGDLEILIISPERRTARLHNRSAIPRSVFDNGNVPDLTILVANEAELTGAWLLWVIDHGSGSQGTLRSWSIELN